ncbi:hypothetical protein ACFU99_15450 [Streptomyces sp. NPDC057654]|uniref:hypothetical protein n=1 Tax=Streptomyces sp. NPDC057654 TaxID=3346196 RepID=UPI0036901E8C
MRTRIKLVLATVGVASVGAAFAGVAIAADPTDNTNVPHAQAAAAVPANGANARKTNTVESVQKVATGRYCINLVPGVDAAKAIPQATLENGADWDASIFLSRNHSSCKNNSIRVTTGTSKGASDQPFYVVIP